MESECPHIAYHPGSPWGDGLKTSNTKVGDMHQWNGISDTLRISSLWEIHLLTKYSLAWDARKIPNLRHAGRPIQQ